MKSILKKLKKLNILKTFGNIFVSYMPKIFIKKSDTFACILITEFNWGNIPIGIDEEYLQKRFELFDKYTFPSVNAQTDKDFTWVLMLNEKTPQKFKDILENYKVKANVNIVLAYTGEDKGYPAGVISKYINVNTKYLLTCRCDNDDMVAKNYIEKIKENFRPVHNTYIDFIRGYCLNTNTGTINTYKYRSCHFLGYIENLNIRNYETVLNHNHAMVKDYGFVRRIDNKSYPLWCEVIHETNQINQFQGSCADEKYLKYFEEYFGQKISDK